MNNQEKNQLIIQEILKWKENRLLPAEQCDFLLALYTKGGEIEIPGQNDIEEQNASLSVWKKLHFVFILFILVSVISLDYYFHSLWYITSSILSVTLIINYLFYSKIRTDVSKRYRYLFIFIQFLYILQLTVFIVEVAGLGNYINFAIILNGAVWIIFGYLKRLPVFSYVGAILIIAVITYVVFFKYIG
ncbi:hypothetical protein [Oceanobacillus neutriphilus]|uniref:DUF2157 domain-containing protein n=1 Tax=Oceanobacillus neutriphilus TaxID=531815 RepID=A0ABQ2NX30_9BACI|nr:hypothetical protein [Oceanobacillus neutriphilus]GGP12692.1 hypothetical protein GCM10011346_29670 [Oceanobacillus neutriphilus]